MPLGRERCASPSQLLLRATRNTVSNASQIERLVDPLDPGLRIEAWYSPDRVHVDVSAEVARQIDDVSSLLDDRALLHILVPPVLGESATRGSLV